MVRPVLEYGITAWATASNTQFYKINKVQNFAACIITGAMKSTPTNTLETMTGLQPMEVIRDKKVIQLAEKFKRLHSHPMYERMQGIEKSRLKRSNFAATAKALTQNVSVLTEAKPKLIPTVSTGPPWEKRLPELREPKMPRVTVEGEWCSNW